MALGKEPYRHIYPADLTALRDVSPLAERVYMHLAFGERSRACCLVACDPEWLRLAVRTRSVPEVVAALAELSEAGWVVFDQSAKQAWLPRQASRTAIAADTNLTGWRREIALFRDSVAKSEALAFIDSIPIPPPKGTGRATDHSISNSNSNELPTNVGSSARDAHATGRTGQTNGNGPRTDDLFAAQPAKAQKRQPRGQDGHKTPKSRTLAQQPPTQDETRSIFAAQGAPESEADKCLDYWRSVGFARRTGPIKDWPATCRTWVAGWRERGSSGGNRQSYGAKPSRALGQEYLDQAKVHHEKWLAEHEVRRQKNIAEGRDPDDIDF